jgi:hypothetical protein
VGLRRVNRKLYRRARCGLVVSGEKAVAAYKADLAAQGADVFDNRDIPLEMDGGQGTAGSHWDDAVFTTELMTGWLNAGAQMSAMPTASLEDMGYDAIFDIENPNVPIAQIDDFQILWGRTRDWLPRASLTVARLWASCLAVGTVT